MDQTTLCHCWRTQTCSNLSQSPAISRNLPQSPASTEGYNRAIQGLHTSDGSPGKNGDRVIVRLATLTQWAVSAMLNTGRIHIFMRVDLLYITRPHAAHTRAPIPGIGRMFPNEPASRIDSRFASDWLSLPYPGRSAAPPRLMCSASEFSGWLRPTTFSRRTARHGTHGDCLSGGPAAMVVRAFYSDYLKF